MSSTADRNYKDIPKKYIDPLHPKDKGDGARVNGKDWKISKDAFRVKSLGVKKISTYEKREQERLAKQQYRARLDALKQEKEDIKKQRVAEIKKRREDKEEKERYARIAAKMHAKRVERLKKREKRNKMLKER